MGQQFSFFLGPDDRLAFESALKQVAEIAFLLDRPTSTKAVQLPGLSEEEMRTLLVRSEDIENLKFVPTGYKLYHSADVLTQNIIECDISTAPHEGFLPAGRLYLVSSYWNVSRQKVKKKAEFLAWADGLYRVAKRSLCKIDRHFYAGEGALKMRANGIKFLNLDGWP